MPSIRPCSFFLHVPIFWPKAVQGALSQIPCMKVPWGSSSRSESVLPGRERDCEKLVKIRKYPSAVKKKGEGGKKEIEKRNHVKRGLKHECVLSLTFANFSVAKVCYWWIDLKLLLSTIFNKNKYTQNYSRSFIENMKRMACRGRHISTQLRLNFFTYST